MRDFTLIIIAAIGTLSFILSIVYGIASRRTKDKNASYISISMMIVAIISLIYLAFK